MINYEDEENLKKMIKLENDSLSSSLDISIVKIYEKFYW